MDRKRFLKYLGSLSLGGTIMKLKDLYQTTSTWKNTHQMPALFLGHGSPMNAIEENEFVWGFRSVSKELPAPRAIFCISAHWETRGTYVTAMEQPRTIHDFGGFPQALYEVEYPAPGSPELAQEIKTLISKANVGLDHQWGLDHGAWSVIKHLYPTAEIPVIQMSLDRSKPPQYHYELGRELAPLRRKGVLIVGSGNLVHNLRMVAWDKLNTPDFGFEWALEAKEKMNEYISTGRHNSLIHYESQGRSFQLAIPTPEHYLPMLYTLALQEEGEEVNLFNDKAVGGAITMTSLKIG
ncbi:MAG: 4,5-DOPA dioxygenase extradiol [Saprospiraceae bacterium]|nr:4,5-DOPA dioxygenase extradiol [Saprospiraceae bacterium]